MQAVPASRFTLIIPTRLPELLKDKRHLQRITATLLLLRSRFPEGRFNFEDMTEVSELFGFKSRKGFKEGHLDALHRIGLLKYEKTAEHHYVTFASWDAIKKHFGYERNNTTTYAIDFCTANNVLALLIELARQSVEKIFHTSFRKNLNGNAELKQAIEDVCGDLSRAAIHHYQLKAFTEGVPAGMSDEYYFSAYMLLHATKTPKAATDEETAAKRFYIKADTNVSVGYLSRVFGYKRRNGACYWKKKNQEIGLIVCNRREYAIAKRLRTTTEQRATGIGNTYYDPVDRTLKLRLTDEWIFIGPETAFSKRTSEIASQTRKAA